MQCEPPAPSSHTAIDDAAPERRPKQRLSWITPARPVALPAGLLATTVSSAAVAETQTTDIFSYAQASGWAEFFTKYGFMGVGLFLFLLAVSFSLVSRDRLVTYICGGVGLSLLLLFAGINFWVTSEPYIVARLPPIVFVRVMNLPDADSVALSPAGSDPPRPYSQRENHPAKKDLFIQKFIIISHPAFDCMTLVLTHNNQDTAFDIKPIVSTDGDGRTEIVLTPKSPDKNMTLDMRRARDNNQVGQDVNLLPLAPGPDGEPAKGCGESSLTRPSAFRGLAALLIPAAQAADDVVQRFSDSLQSSDVFTRRRARRDLATLGRDALPVIAALLQTDNYRLRLGALEALGDLSPEVRRAAPDEIWSHRAQLFADPDDAMKNAALRAYDLNDAPLAYCYQERDDRKPADQRFLALCQWTEADCAQIRGNNTNTKQTACTRTSVRDATQRLQPGGIHGSWFKYAATSFGAPYPQLSP